MTEFKDIVGKRFGFYGVDGNRFKLGRWVFEALEDEEDGYRSHLKDIERRDHSDAIFFKRVLAVVKVIEFEETEGYGDEGWRFVDVKDGHVWLEIGTNNVDDYYPCFYFRYNAKEEHS